MHPIHRSLLPLSIIALVSCDSGQQPLAPSQGQTPISAAAGGIPLQARMEFGIDEHGSPFPPPSGHDASGHARDHIYPREVVIARGGSVTMRIDLVHQPAVYDRGVQPSDIVVSPATLEDVNLGPFTLPAFRINDPNHRLALGPAQRLFEQDWTTPPGTFDQPGRYLIICTTLPHFVDSKMWGWVTVK